MTGVTAVRGITMDQGAKIIQVPKFYMTGLDTLVTHTYSPCVCIFGGNARAATKCHRNWNLFYFRLFRLVNWLVALELGNDMGGGGGYKWGCDDEGDTDFHMWREVFGKRELVNGKRQAKRIVQLKRGGVDGTLTDCLVRVLFFLLVFCFCFISFRWEMNIFIAHYVWCLLVYFLLECCVGPDVTHMFGIVVIINQWYAAK